jgi:uncharacterized membrane protein SpoIIM required for sporulation
VPVVDVDAFVAVHAAEWTRLEQLLGRASRLSGDEAEELVALYQRTATHLSTVQSAAPDPALVGRLSSLVGRARAAVTGTSSPARRDVAQFFLRRFPAAVYRAWPWWVGVGAAFYAVVAAMAIWVGQHPRVQGSIASSDYVRELTRPGGQFESYYSDHAATSFAARVWTNNVWVAAAGLAFGVLIVPVVYLLWQNATNLAVGLGLMGAAGRLGIFLGLLAPHGLLELTAVFVSSGVGLRLGWTVIDPGPRTRSAALAVEGRAAMGVALGLIAVLAVSGVLEAFVTPSGLPTAVRVGIGAAAELVFLLYVFLLGGRAARAGETGDVDASRAGDVLPTVG